MTDDCINVGLIGEPEVGKTKLVIRIKENSFDPSRVETISPDFYEVTRNVDGIVRKFKIWDVPGQQNSRNTSTVYIRKCHVILAVFDPKKPESINELDTWEEKINKQGAKSYIPVASKHDLWQGQNLYRPRDILRNVPKERKSEVIETSAQNGFGVEELLRKIVEVGQSVIMKQNNQKGVQNLKSGPTTDPKNTSCC